MSERKKEIKIVQDLMKKKREKTDNINHKITSDRSQDIIK